MYSDIIRNSFFLVNFLFGKIHKVIFGIIYHLQNTLIKLSFANIWAYAQARGSQTGVHLGFSRGTLLCEKISLFKLNSVSERNNRPKCVEFSNPVDCYYVKHIAVPAGGQGGNCPPSFQDLDKIQIFWAVTGKYLGKVRSFRALTLNNCKNQLPNLGEDLFFLENTLILGRKLKNM